MRTGSHNNGGGGKKKGERKGSHLKSLHRQCKLLFKRNPAQVKTQGKKVYVRSYSRAGTFFEEPSSGLKNV